MHLFPPYPSEKELKKVNDNYGLCVICTRNLNLNLQNLIIFFVTDWLRRGEICTDIGDEHGDTAHRRHRHPHQTEAPNLEPFRHPLGTSHYCKQHRLLEQPNSRRAAVGESIVVAVGVGVTIWRRLWSSQCHRRLRSRARLWKRWTHNSCLRKILKSPRILGEHQLRVCDSH